MWCDTIERLSISRIFHQISTLFSFPFGRCKSCFRSASTIHNSSFITSHKACSRKHLQEIMRNVVPYSQKDIDAYKEARANSEGDSNRVDEFLPSAGYRSPGASTGRKKLKSPMSGATASRESRPDGWLGSPAKNQKRSWKVKAVKQIKPVDLDA